VPHSGQQHGLSPSADGRGASDFMRCVQFAFAVVQLHPHSSFGLHKRVAKRMHLSVDVVGVEDGLGDFFTQELCVPTAKAKD
jgi:hypothetical protein